MNTGKKSPQTFVLCSGNRLAEYTRQLEINLGNEIANESDDYISKVDEANYIDYLTKKYSIKVPYLDFEGIEATTGKRMVQGKDFPYSINFRVRKEQSYEIPTFIYYIPCEGDVDLFKYNADSIYYINLEVYIEDGCICFEVFDYYNNLEAIKNSAKSTIENIKRTSKEFIIATEKYNYSLESKIKDKIKERKQRINSIVHTLGVPIRKRDNLSDSYTIPSLQSKKTISLKPQITNHEGKVEYILEEAIYTDILQVIHDYGKGFEQYPSISKGKEEEEIRDHFLFVLQPRYNWTAAGEAFNKLGKTDILIKFEKTIVFIAECKFWRGHKGYLATISQLFDRYLIWRNSKAAIVIFVKNKDFSAVISEVKNVTPNHPNFVKFVNEKDDTWLNYVFHINDNPNREVKLAVLLFHIPQTKGISDKTNN